VLENPHFLSVANLEEAADHLGFVPLGHRVPYEPKAVRIHIRDHRGREVVPTLETFYDQFLFSQQRPGSPDAVRLALDESYGPDRVALEVGGHSAAGYELGEEPNPTDPDPRQPSVVTWADGEFFFMLASDQMHLPSLLAVADSLYE
jgi:hypothetical protein